MIDGVNLPAGLVADANGLGELKRAARDNSPETIKQVARQFEAIFMNMMLKSMREASPQESPFDNEQSKMFTGMLDQQLSAQLASKGLGLADVLARQLTQGQGSVPVAGQELTLSTQPQGNGTVPASPVSTTSTPQTRAMRLFEAMHAAMPETARTTGTSAVLQPENSATASVKSNQTDTPESINSFLQRMSRHAESASAKSGIPTNWLLGQAALETGWGKKEIQKPDGTPSYNLFGIKAGSNWEGKVVEAVTTEYSNGSKQKRVEKFRAYDSYAESFTDFARLMQNNPRFSTAIAQAQRGQSHEQYAQALQQAGYATDPAYANKLTQVIKRVNES